MKPASVWSLIKSDVERYAYLQRHEIRAGKKSLFDGLRAYVLCQGLQASIIYRIGQRIYSDRTPRLLQALLKLPYFCAQRQIESTTGISISPRADIGPGLYIGHFGGVIIGNIKAGVNATISHEVTLGQGVSGGSTSFPQLGDRVWIGPGAKLAGGIAIGDDALIGANAVVISDVPPWGLAVGVPATIRKNRGSFDMVIYEGMEADADRNRSLDEMALATKVVEINPGAPLHK